MQEDNNASADSDVSRRGLVAAGLTAGLAIAAQATPAAAQSTGTKKYVTNELTQSRTYSQAIVTQGGKTVYLCGVTEAADASGKSLAGNFEGQARAVFETIRKTLEAEGGKLSDLVTITCFLKDVRYRQVLKDIRKELFVDKFPASAMITVSALNDPDLLLEIQGIAVIV